MAQGRGQDNTVKQLSSGKNRYTEKLKKKGSKISLFIQETYPKRKLFRLKESATKREEH